MANCEVEIKVHAYHDGELPPAERKAVEEHLKACPECAKCLEDLRGMSRLFATARLPELSPAALTRLHRGKVLVLEPMMVHISEFFAAAAAALLVVCAAWLWHASARAETADNAMPTWQEAAVTLTGDAATDNDPGANEARMVLAAVR